MGLNVVIPSITSRAIRVSRNKVAFFNHGNASINLHIPGDTNALLCSPRRFVTEIQTVAIRLHGTGFNPDKPQQVLRIRTRCHGSSGVGGCA